MDLSDCDPGSENADTEQESSSTNRPTDQGDKRVNVTPPSLSLSPPSPHSKMDEDLDLEENLTRTEEKVTADETLQVPASPMESESDQENESKKENITLVKSQSTGITSSLIEKEDQLLTQETDPKQVMFQLPDNQVIGSDTLMDEENIEMAKIGDHLVIDMTKEGDEQSNESEGVRDKENTTGEDEQSNESDSCHDKGMLEMENTTDLQTMKEKDTSLDVCDLCLMILTAESLP